MDCSTLRVEDMLHMESAVLERGGRFLEAPVSGSKVPAENGQLIFLCAGDEKLYNDQFLQQAFDLMGKKAFYLGKAGNGTKMKVRFFHRMASALRFSFFLHV